MNPNPKFTYYHVHNVISDESATRGDYASSERTNTSGAGLKKALELLNSDCWDNVDFNGDTIICYPADYRQDATTGDYSGSQLILTARRPEWAERLMDIWEAQRKQYRESAIYRLRSHS
jgi:hypothetical protein